MTEKNSKDYFSRTDAADKQIYDIDYGLEDILYFLRAKRYKEAEFLIVSAILSKKELT